ncbi:MAG: phosphoribosylamine--glycine ligase [Erysipelotrichaceae bacterium]|nr:phosphoribosylamine--glycine ligase [Erysipelotrichaceae bacterium]
MKVLVVGSGGREHAIVHALSKSSKVTEIYAAPGNAGIAKLAMCVNIKDTDVNSLVEFAKAEAIDLVVVGPEAALAVGVVDEMTKANIKAFGPTKAAAQIEASKKFAKDLMFKYNIPTAKYESFSDYEEALAYVKANSIPTVLKYDGLAAGKGVVVAMTMDEAVEALKDMLLDDKFGHGKVVIEEYLEGPEFSFMCFVDNENVYPLEMAQDHKRAYDNDMGPNTGGMGAYSPLPFITEEDYNYAMNEIMIPTAKAMVKEGVPFKGVLYGGLMKTKNGIKVIEFNARFGDPETEVVLPRLSSDIYDAFVAIVDGNKPVLEWEDCYTIGIVLASKGYPGSYEKGFVIENADSDDIYHMGTKIDDNGNLVTNGGRVLFAVAKGNTLEEANKKANKLVDEIKCENLFHRTDIGAKAYKK